MPGVTMSDSEYRITNTPQLKYAYGAVFNEFAVTFTMDANSNIRKLFDKWTNIIYPYSQFRGVGDGVLRTRYKDDYIADITVVKYERGSSSARNKMKGKRITGKRIIPDGGENRDSLFLDNVAVHGVTMKNAFPKSIDSMTLSGDAGQLTQFSVLSSTSHYKQVLPLDLHSDKPYKYFQIILFVVMPLPNANAPTYELVLPSTGKKIRYRPFLVKEEKFF